ncbi:CheY-like receiver, AAA-type ATPase and DNA-binding domain-containing response regulator [Desulfocapsa sulfexigens DSM 10523]|uniref:CheY-like receiver, AAA-type ATPase and DNA-binding domain-containing response regulator n=1 Tax=Desulfocapsa sulfexigens (strain DSM 10523 / SB164P1) TaxID=1167006 RepID=M1PA52_DESSD|nr:response regulator [Desulfocapsa sulfexigens]AGF78502.1 CheY-like receiver, AAA-type ATPase and DNA-binding domain-containing response regulator [Desulfocapsa sulfexigens DSM 10523]
MIKSKVLIIDDEIEFATTLCQRLKLRGMAAIDVHSGTEGLVSLVKMNPGIVILDLKMPDMSGLDVLAKVKQHDPSIEVIMLTGHGSAEAGAEAKEKGAFDYIMKPVDLVKLVDKMELADEKRSKA